MAQQQVADHDDRPKMRSRSNTTTSHQDRTRPISRTSDTSLQSVDVGHSFQTQIMPSDQHRQHQYVPVQPHPGQQVLVQAQSNQHAMMQAYPPPQPIPQHMSHAMAQPLPPHMVQAAYHQQHVMEPVNIVPQHDMRPVSQQGYHESAYGPQYPAQVPQYQPHMQHFRRDSMQYEGSPAPEDSNNENKRKKGTASTMANDQELRRLLQQHEGKTLKDVALEVQKTEGHNNGGKAEKAKQVFAMLWLRENCVRTGNSVRRDRVFAKYTERCGGERVPTLNPASFGKLVRIIFPNVQTRRLGVRGESKYHYVDLSLMTNDDEDRMFSTMPTSFNRPSTSNGVKTDSGQADERHVSAANDGRPVSRQDMETADFPVPRAESLPEVAPSPKPVQEEPSIAQPNRLCCINANTGVIRIPVRGLTNALVFALPAALPHLPGTIPTYEAMPNPGLISQQDSVQAEEAPAPVELPDIAPYLAGVEHDPSIARSLFHLYRSYCTDVIESFRLCREKSYFQHHTAFNGKMTVPVSKLFNLECLAPWIHECDMRMYKQLARFLAPLALQNVPSVVWTVFQNIATKLVNHIIGAFEEKCPVHVVVAKIVPAARFVNLLRKLKAANDATQQMARLLNNNNATVRTQMWLDLLAMVDPDTVLEDGRPPIECLQNIQGVLKHDMRTLLDPTPGDMVAIAEDDVISPYPIFLSEPSAALTGVLSLEALNQSTSLVAKWISWLQCLPQTFEGHHSACMLNWHGKFWRSILRQLAREGATSFQHWWYAEDFTTSLLSWMAELQGLLMSEADQKLADACEMEKMQQILSSSSSTLGKRKREMDSYLADPRGAKRVEPAPNADSAASTPQEEDLPKEDVVDDEEPDLPELPHGDPNDTDAEMEEMSRAGPLRLPSYPGYTMTSPLKMSKTPMRAGHGGVNDDSGIDIGLDLDAMPTSHVKFSNNDWLVSSDPAEPRAVV